MKRKWHTLQLFNLVVLLVLLPSCRTQKKVVDTINQQQQIEQTTQTTVAIASDSVETVVSLSENGTVVEYETADVVETETTVAEIFDSTGAVVRRVTTTRTRRENTATATNTNTASATSINTTNVSKTVDSVKNEQIQTDTETVATHQEKAKTKTTPIRNVLFLLAVACLAVWYVYKNVKRG